MAARLAAKAKADLSDIWSYVADEGGISTSHVARSAPFCKKSDFQSSHPYAGRERNDLSAGMRSFPVRQAVIFYRVELPDVLILRVLHGRRDIHSILEQ
jgi:toxin ParE1/3/4